MYVYQLSSLCQSNPLDSFPSFVRQLNMYGFQKINRVSLRLRPRLSTRVVLVLSLIDFLVLFSISAHLGTLVYLQLVF